MNSQHVTDLHTAHDVDGNARYRPACSCGWRGALVVDPMLAKNAAFAHREAQREHDAERTTTDSDNHT